MKLGFLVEFFFRNAGAYTGEKDLSGIKALITDYVERDYCIEGLTALSGLEVSQKKRHFSPHPGEHSKLASPESIEIYCMPTGTQVELEWDEGLGGSFETMRTVSGRLVEAGFGIHRDS